MKSRDFRNAINNLMTQKNNGWIIYGDGHMCNDVLTFADINFLINAVDFSQPTSLGLANMNCGDEQMLYLVRGLQHNKSINVLYFPFNHLGDKAAAALAELLLKKPHIKELILFCNKIGDTGITALASMLCANNTLLKMELFKNAFTRQAGAVLAQALKSNHTIKTLLLYPAKDGIRLTDKTEVNHAANDLLRWFHKMMLINVNKPENTGGSAPRKLITRR